MADKQTQYFPMSYASSSLGAEQKPVQTEYFKSDPNYGAPQGMQWNEQALKDYGFTQEEMARLKEAALGMDADSLKYFADQGWLTPKQAPRQEAPKADSGYTVVPSKGQAYQAPAPQETPSAPQPTQADYDNQAKYEAFVKYKAEHPDEFQGDTWVGSKPTAQPTPNYQLSITGYQPLSNDALATSKANLDKNVGMLINAITPDTQISPSTSGVGQEIYQAAKQMADSGASDKTIVDSIRYWLSGRNPYYDK